MKPGSAVWSARCCRPRKLRGEDHVSAEGRAAAGENASRRWFVGGFPLLIGLIAPIGASQYRTMQNSALRAPWKRGRLFANPRADAAACFWIGLALAAAGLVMQTAGGLAR